MRRHIRLSVFAVLLLSQAITVHATTSIPGDFNNDGIVSHADYSYLADNWSSHNNHGDIATYNANYGETPPAGASPLVLSASSSIVAGNTEWVISFTGLSSALAAYLNIDSTALVLSAASGTLFRDYMGMGAGLRGFDADGVKQTGTFFSGTSMFASLGTNVAGPPFTFNPLTPVEFVRFTTQGTSPTTITIRSGLGGGGQQLSALGYGGRDYNVTAPLTFSTAAVPEASSFAAIALVASVSAAWVARRRRSL